MFKLKQLKLKQFKLRQFSLNSLSLNSSSLDSSTLDSFAVDIEFNWNVRIRIGIVEAKRNPQKFFPQDV